MERIQMALPLDESAVKTMMAPKAATRVAFGTLVECGMIAPGTLLTDTKRRWKAKVRVDGSLDCEGQAPGSIHKVGAGVQRSEEHTSELQSLMRPSYAVF